MRARGLAALALLLAAVAFACAATGRGARDPLAAGSGYRVAASRAGMFTAAWKVVGRDDVPENRAFELDLFLYRGVAAADEAVHDAGGALAPLEHAEVLVSAWMPDHGHGMNRKPEATEVEPGRYRVRGMLLHMGGFWQLFVDVIAGGVSERAQFELELE